ncbi:MAG: hypothetical protein C4308_03490 [Chitinophagaceae bacterium]
MQAPFKRLGFSFYIAAMKSAAFLFFIFAVITPIKKIKKPKMIWMPPGNLFGLRWTVTLIKLKPCCCPIQSTNLTWSKLKGITRKE